MNKLSDKAISGVYCWGCGKHLGEWKGSGHRYCDECKLPENIYGNSFRVINEALESIARLMDKRTRGGGQ